MRRCALSAESWHQSYPPRDLLRFLRFLRTKERDVGSERQRWAESHRNHAAELRNSLKALKGEALRVAALDALWHEQQAQRLEQQIVTPETEPQQR